MYKIITGFMIPTCYVLRATGYVLHASVLSGAAQAFGGSGDGLFHLPALSAVANDDARQPHKQAGRLAQFARYLLDGRISVAGQSGQSASAGNHGAENEVTCREIVNLVAHC